MKSPFKRIGLAIAFSPTGKALLNQAKRLQELFNAELILIHVGEKSEDRQKMLDDLLLPAGFEPGCIKVIWEDGDPVKVIKAKCEENNIDLLIVGALEEENFLRYYLGSVARKIMRDATCSVLVLTNPSEEPKHFKRFCVAVDFTSAGENTIKKSYQFALLDNASHFNLVREFNIPGLMMTVSDLGASEESNKEKNDSISEEKMKVEMLIKELNLVDIDITTTCLYGKEGFEANKYVKQSEADIFCITAPSKKLKFIDRLFPHEVEYTFESLPSNLLIVKS